MINLMGRWKNGVSHHVRYAWNRYDKLLVLHDIGTVNILTHVQRYIEHVVITRYFIVLPGTDYPIKVKESQ